MRLTMGHLEKSLADLPVSLPLEDFRAAHPEVALERQPWSDEFARGAALPLSDLPDELEKLQARLEAERKDPGRVNNPPQAARKGIHLGVRFQWARVAAIAVLALMGGMAAGVGIKRLWKRRMARGRNPNEAETA